MATARLVPSSYSVSNSNYVTFSDNNHPATNMYANTDSTTYATVRGRNSSNTSRVYYLYIKGFDFNSIPSNATVSSFSIKIKAYKNSYQRTGETYRPKLASSASNNSVISNTTLSSDITTTSGGTVYTFPTSSLAWNTLKNYGSDFTIVIPLCPSSNQYPYVYIYGAEINVTYTAETVHVTGVSLNKATTSIEEGETETLTATVTPSNATDTTVSWSSNTNSVATVSNGVVTAVSAGTAVITATTTDGSYTTSCTVTVTQPVYIYYKQVNTFEVGNSYLIVYGNTGTVYLLSNESGGSRQLKGVAATVTNGLIGITASTQAKTLFTCNLTVAGNSVTTGWGIGNQYLYCDNSTGFRMNSPATLDRFWHWQDNKFWQFKSTSSNGYTDESSEYKYYLTLNASNNFTDNHVTSPSIADTDIPAIYLFKEFNGVSVTGVDLNKSTDSIKVGGTTTLTATVSPNNATDQSVTWGTSNSSVATVNNGVITGVSAGTAVITVTTVDGGYTDTCTVTVTQPDKLYIKLPSTPVSIGSAELATSGGDASISPINASESDVVSGSTMLIVGNLKTYNSSTYTSFNDEFTVPQQSNYAQNILQKGGIIVKLFISSSLRQFQIDSTSNADVVGNYEIFKYVGGGWTEANKVYKKVSGSWVEQTNLTSVFDSGTNYKYVE